jgi:hypothetical protein
MIIGLCSIVLHYLVIEKKSVKRLIRFSDISNMIVGLSFVLKNYLLGHIGLLFSTCSLIGKTFVLQKYKIKDLQDFIIHYLSVLLALYWLFSKEKWSVENNVIMKIILVIFLLHILYYNFTNKYVYLSMPIDKLKGITSYVFMLMIMLFVNSGFKYMEPYIPDTYRYDF